MNRAFKAWAQFLERFFPDPFSLSLFLTLVTLVVAKCLTPSTVPELASYWGTGLWDFLGFAMAMGLILVTGQALAEAPLFSGLLHRLAAVPKSMSSGIVVVTLGAMVTAWLNWGFGLVIGALLARQVADSLAQRFGEENVARGMLGAAGYTGLAFWHGGLSGSAPLAVAQAGHSLEEQVGVIAMTETVGSSKNLCLSLVLLVMVPLFLVVLNRSGLAVTNQPVESKPVPEEAPKPGAWERVLVALVTGLALYWWCFHRGSLDLNTVIFAFLFLGLAAHGSASGYARALDRATAGISGIVLQFPFYAGIVGIASKSGLVSVVSNFFVSASLATQEAFGFQPFLVFVFLSAGLANLFVPSGGGQWMIQGPIVLKAAAVLGIAPSSAILAVSYGDQWTNLLQPFWALPLLSITGLKPAQLLSITTLLLVWVGLIISMALMLY